jgi:glycosyltransferase involved in cell wall biosynthesis
MLQTLLDGGPSSEHEFELAFLEDGAWPRQLSREGFEVEVIPAGRLRDPLRMLACVRALARIMRATRPDLIVGWIAKAQIYGAPAAALAGMGGRVIWWQHQITSGHWIDRLATLLPARAVGCCSRAAAEAQSSLRPRRRTFVAAPGTAPPSAAEQPAEALPSDGLPVVGLVGRLQPGKGQDRLLRAQVLLRERGHAVHALLVGGDAHGLSSEYAASLAPLVEELGLTGSVTMTGQVEQPGPLIDRMDILLSASEQEGFGLVLLEAMARRVPVVAVDGGGPAEIIEDGHSGVLVGSGAPGVIADALEPLIVDPELRERLGRGGYERFMREFTDVAMRERLLARLAELAGEAGAR